MSTTKLAGTKYKFFNRLIYFIEIATASGFQHSRMDAWKYHPTYPKEPEQFARQYAKKLFKYENVVTVKVTVINIHRPVDRYSLVRFEQYDFWGDYKDIDDPKIIEKYTFTKDSFASKAGDNNA